MTARRSLKRLLANVSATFDLETRKHRRRRSPSFCTSSESVETRCLMSAANGNPGAPDAVLTQNDSSTSLYGSVTFDFGTDQSPVESGSIQVSSNIRYSPERGYGMLSNVNDVDRGQDDDLNRDFVAGKTVSFRVDVPNGIYQVEPGLGDRTRLRDRIQISVNGDDRDVVTTLGGTPSLPSYYVVVTDGSITLEATDLGGDSKNAAVTSLTITALDDSYGIPDDNPADAVAQNPMIIIETHGRVSPPTKNGGLLGTVVAKAAGEAASAGVGGVAGDIVGDVVEAGVKSAFPSEGRPDAPDWVYELARAMAQSTRRETLGNLNPNVRPIELPKIERANGDKELLALQRGSRDFIAVNWSTESSFGTPQNGEDLFGNIGDEYKEKQHRKSVTRAATATFRLLEARIRQELQKNPSAKVDLLIVGHSFGATVNREVILMLNQSGLADHVDFVKVVEMDPVAMKADENPGERADSHDRYFWSHPETARNGRPIVDSVVNYYQTEALAFSGIVEKGLITGRPLDGKDGGGLLGFRNGHAMVFDPISGKQIDLFRNVKLSNGKPSDGDLRDGTYSDDGRFLMTASEDGTVSLRDAKTHQEIRRIVIAKTVVTDAEFLPGSKEIATVSKDGQIRIIRISDGVELWSDRHKGPSVEDSDGNTIYKGAKQVAISSDGRLMATAGSANLIKIWIREPGNDVKFQYVQSLPGHKGGTTSIAFASNGTLVTGGNDGKLRIWKQGASVYELRQEVDLTVNIRNAVFSDDGRYLAVAAGRTVSLWMTSADGTLIRTREFLDHVDAVYALAFTADGSRLATGGLDHTIFIYDTASGSKVNVLNQAMLGVRSLSYSTDGSQLLATYFDLKGGPVKDINVTEQVKSRVGFFENLFSGGSKHHSEVPFVYIDQVIRKTNDSFFEMRDKPRASRYGDFEPEDLTKWDNDSDTTGNYGGDSDQDLVNPWLEQFTNLHAPEFTESLQSVSVSDLMAILLDRLAIDADGNELRWSVRSSNTQTILAVIEGNSLKLRPLKEGSSEIELTVNDGRWAAQIRFTAIADGTAWRDKASQIRNDAANAAAELDSIRRQIDRLDNAISAVNDQWKSVADKVDRLSNKTDEARQDVKSAAARVDRLRQSRDSLLAAKTVAQGNLSRAEAALQSSLSTFSRLDSQTRQLYQGYNQRTSDKQRAKQLLDNATKKNRPDRQTAFNTASAAAAQAESAWRSSQAQRDSASRVVDANRKQRDNFASDVNRNSNLLSNAESDLSRAMKDHADANSRLTSKLSERNGLLPELGGLQSRIDGLNRDWTKLNHDRESFDAMLQDLRQQLVSAQQNKWVDRLGLEKIDEQILSPAQRLAKKLNSGLTDEITRINRVKEKISGSVSQLNGLG